MFILHLWEERKEVNKETKYKLQPLSVFGCQIKQIQSVQFMVTFTSQLAGFASGIFIVASRPPEIPVVDCSLWSFAIDGRWQTGFTGPGETCKLAHHEFRSQASYTLRVIWHLFTAFDSGKNNIQGNNYTDLSLHLLRKTPLLSGYSLLQGPLSVHEDTL